MRWMGEEGRVTENRVALSGACTFQQLRMCEEVHVQETAD